MSWSEESGYINLKLLIFLPYGFFVLSWMFCFVCGYGPFSVQEENPNSDNESNSADGVILSEDTKNEINRLRETVFHRLLGNFSLTLQRKEHMLRRGASNALDTHPSSDVVQTDIEEGGESATNGPPDNDKIPDPGVGMLMEYTHILIPCSGADVNGKNIDADKDAKKDAKEDKREVPIFCAICLSGYEVGDEVCWSSNSNCTHVFHVNCVVEWLAALGRRKSPLEQFRSNPSEEELINYPLECPCCRQEFILAKTTKCSMSA